MPELPEVETTVKGLAPVLEGRRLVTVEPRRADLRWPLPPDLRQRLTGALVTSLGRRAKFGLIGTDRGDTLVFHLGMSGRWRIDPQELGKHDHFLLETEDGGRLALNDPRRFGSLDLVRTEALCEYEPFRKMGPEPLSEDFSGGWLRQALKGRKAPVKALLLDQRIVAGLGNIYVCEALWRARIAPKKPAGKLKPAALDSLAHAVREVLEEAIAAGGSTLRDFAGTDGELGYFQHRFSAYSREGEACAREDAGVVRRIVQAGRSTFFCPRCQR